MTERRTDIEHHDSSDLAVEEARPKVKPPPLYRVLLINDDFTPMEFVVDILESIFGMERTRATQVMLEVHTKGRGICGGFQLRNCRNQGCPGNDNCKATAAPAVVHDGGVLTVLSSELEFCLNEAFQKARDQRHEFMTVEHLLLALLDIPSVHEIIKACDGNIAELRRQLTECVEEQTPLLPEDEDLEVQQHWDFNAFCSERYFMCSRAARKK